MASLKSVSTRDGELHLKWADGTAVFELGEHAEKWAHKILHPKSTAEKLGVKPDLVISAIGMEHPDFLRDLCQAAKNFSDLKPLKDSDLVFLGASAVAALRCVPKLKDSLSANGALWIVYPKGLQEIKEVHVLEAGRAAGLFDVKVVSFSATTHGTEVRAAEGEALIDKRKSHPSERLGGVLRDEIRSRR